MGHVASLVEARELVLTKVFDEQLGKKDSLVILDDKTIEKSYGWIFFFQSQKYVETHRILHLLVGNGPIIILRDGTTHRLGTAHPIGAAITDFERRHGLPPT